MLEVGEQIWFLLIRSIQLYLLSKEKRENVVIINENLIFHSANMERLHKNKIK